MTAQVIKALINSTVDSKVSAVVQQLNSTIENKIAASVVSLTNAFQSALEDALLSFDGRIDEATRKAIQAAVGKDIVHLADIKSSAVRAEIQKLLDAGAIDGGTDASVDPTDIRMPYQLVRVMAVNARYADKLKGE